MSHATSISTEPQPPEFPEDLAEPHEVTDVANLIAADLGDDEFGPRYPLDRVDFVNTLARRSMTSWP